MLKMKNPAHPAHPPPYDSDDDAATRPCFSLLEKYAYYDNRKNATTAACDLDNGRIQVTFCAAHPPRASYFCVHATGLGRRTRLGAEPQILATEGPLALIRVIIHRRKSPSPLGEGEYFVYHAGGNPSEERRPPSLKRLPDSSPNFFNEFSAAILRHCPRRTQRRRGGLSGFALRPHGRDRKEEDHDCGDCSYVIAALLTMDSDSMTPYELCRYHSKTETWSAPVLMVPEQEPAPYPNGSICRAINIGGEAGTVGWADLGTGVKGIIFCDVLTITDSSPPPVLRCLYMPLLKASGIIEQKREESSSYVRDINLVDGSIVYIEVQIPGPDPYSPINKYAWTATTWRIKINNSMLESQWQLTYKFGSSEISKSLRDKLQVRDADTIFYIGMPVLSLQEDGIVYILTKTDSRDSKSWVLAIDMKKKKIKELDEFDTNRRVCLYLANFTPSRITKYLQVDQGKQTEKRQKMTLQRHSCEKLPGTSMADSKDNMELDDEDEDEDGERLCPPEPVVPPPTLKELRLELACKPWLLNLDELMLERAGKWIPRTRKSRYDSTISTSSLHT